MVKYCNAACKKKHRSKHKKACEKRVGEIRDKELFKEHPPNEDCPICFLPLPHAEGQIAFQSCCGKVICFGCIYVMMGTKGGKIGLCAFCRTPSATSDEKEIQRLKRLMEANNEDAFYALAGYYATGDYGMPQDRSKANELCLRAGELGCAVAYHNLGNSYLNGGGVRVDKKRAKYYYELAAMNGSVLARHKLGIEEFEAGNYDRAMKHFMLSAKSGLKRSLDSVKTGFMRGYVAKDEYANTLRAYQQRHDEMKSEDRDKAEELYHLYNARAS